MKLLTTSEDERRIRRMSDARAMQDAFQRREINLSRRSSGTYGDAVTDGVDYRQRCKCRCNARTTCGSRAAPRDSSLSPAGELYRAQYYPGRTSIFRVHVKSIWSFDIPGCRSGTIASSPCHAATQLGLYCPGLPARNPRFRIETKSNYPSRTVPSF